MPWDYQSKRCCLLYKKELTAIKRANRLREREVFSDDLLDFASNDYLGLSQNKELLKRAYERVLEYKYHSPKASMLVNGYHQVHKEFESYMSKLCGFEESIVVGSGYLANIALIESMVRRDDVLLLDSEFHASGVMASKLALGATFTFSHNDEKDLEKLLKSLNYKRAIICVEGVYSMEGDLVNPEIFEVADRYEAILIVDEAHSSGTVGKNLLGVFDLYDIEPKKNHIKMATLGKAVGSYGAYIQGSTEIVSYLINRAKSIIYSTAPSVFDIALAHEGYKYIQKNRDSFLQKKDEIYALVEKKFKITPTSLILKLEYGDNQKVLNLKEVAKKEGFLIGAIRPPTVKSAIVRIILRLNHDRKDLERLFAIFDNQQKK